MDRLQLLTTLRHLSIGSAASFQGTMLYGPGATNDVVSDINPFAIIIGGPILNVS